jgi:AraC-like DNA-binding protein
MAAWGVTFEQLLDDFRLHHALIMLRDDEHSITDVAFDLGYSDAAHFTRAFRRWTGVTPRQFRGGPTTVPRTITSLLAPAVALDAV